jgi:hypothetical protein
MLEKLKVKSSKWKVERKDSSLTHFPPSTFHWLLLENPSVPFHGCIRHALFYWGVNSFQWPSETTSALPSITLIAV